MWTNAKRLVATLLTLAMFGTTAGALAATPPGPSEADAIGRTPPRVSYINGEVSFRRQGAQEEDWAPVQLNSPLAPGDELYTGHQGNLELQVGTRAFVRAWGDTQLGLANEEPDFLQFTVVGGHVSLDLRSLETGRSVELNTPRAAFTVESPGYYRVDVTQGRTSFITRRGGRATMTPPGGQAVAITPSEEVILEGTPVPTAQSYVAPEFDTWDRWNYARTDQLLEAVSARYVSRSVYGVDDLDHYGNWRVVPTYGPVWIPQAVAAGWVPYSTGRWMWDPYYGWTWVDSAPWGWAPFHYGRWVFVDGFWAWAPGPVVVRPVYAPALVAFFGAPGISVSVGTPVVSWVALGWGEPLVPWWGRPGFVGRPWWAGWGGPRNHITGYKNVSVQNAVVAVPRDRFGRRPIHETRIAQPDVRHLEPVHGPLQVKPEASSFTVSGGGAARPPDARLSRLGVATRTLANRPATPHRPPVETSALERPRPPLAPRFEAPQGREAAPAAPRDVVRRPGVATPQTQERARGLERPTAAPAGEHDRR